MFVCFEDHLWQTGRRAEILYAVVNRARQCLEVNDASGKSAAASVSIEEGGALARQTRIVEWTLILVRNKLRVSSFDSLGAPFPLCRTSSSSSISNSRQTERRPFFGMKTK